MSAPPEVRRAQHRETGCGCRHPQWQPAAHGAASRAGPAFEDRDLPEPGSANSDYATDGALGVSTASAESAGAAFPRFHDWQAQQRRGPRTVIWTNLRARLAPPRA